MENQPQPVQDQLPSQNPGVEDFTPPSVDLEAELARLGRVEEDLFGRKAHLVAKISSLAVKKSLTDGETYDAAVVLGSSRVTDQNKPGYRRESSVLPETASSKRTLGAFMGKLVTPTSVHNGGAEEIKASAAQRPSNSEKSKKQLRAELRSIKRLNKQTLRQSRTKDAEVAFGGGIGLGQTAKVRTRLDRHRQSASLRREFSDAPTSQENFANAKDEFKDRYQQLLEQYDNGELTEEQFVALNRADNLEFKAIETRHKKGPMTSDEYLKRKSQIKKSAVVVPTKEARRKMRRERAGGTFIITKARSPIASKINEINNKRINRKLDKVSTKLEANWERQEEIEAELARRANAEDE